MDDDYRHTAQPATDGISRPTNVNVGDIKCVSVHTRMRVAAAPTVAVAALIQ